MTAASRLQTIAAAIQLFPRSDYLAEWRLLLVQRVSPALMDQAAATRDGGKRNPTKAQRLRELLEGPGIVQGPACHDALSAHLIERAGFKLAFMSGFSVSATRLAAPDAGLISYGEMVDQARLIAAATRLPVIGDGDTGYGNAMNVKRTVEGYARVGMAGILIEDQCRPECRLLFVS
ncbi:phosphoenolpyruvate carboxylase family protein [Klebsormidium nitens]|uniref:Phosphoenolpyruvate carboxylase family protein n=1 Tax=Klebsormidium nitens TaxID=105231 RepID=A0A1Y1I0K4_KLENI|nr:phosphoenolpyruvate carboxylase family protein [Klebsormidium nitens]|eukprot:GAQ83983.1 phosphoenolpyruvate carboxylase family protein [Klebsormidium nitens]